MKAKRRFKGRFSGDAWLRSLTPPAPPQQDRFIETLERGLALQLVNSYGGSKTWSVITYVNGKAKPEKLGKYPAMSLKQAKAAARERFEIPDKFAAHATAGSFKDVAQNWIKRVVEKKKLLTEREIKRHLEVYVYPKWAERPFYEIKRADAAALKDHIEDNHGATQATAVLGTVRSIMNWYAEERDESYVVPLSRKMCKRESGARDRVLDDDELRALWKACDEVGVFGDLLKVLLLTAQRREKVLTMRWDDLSPDRAVWTIPRHSVREKGTAMMIRLPQIVIDIINRQPSIVGNPYVFASGRHLHFKSLGGLKQGLDKKLPSLPRWTPHDLRRSARSLMSRAGVQREIAERVLGHTQGGVDDIYDRHRYFDEKSAALRRLADLVGTILNPRAADNVVPMSRAGS